MLQIKEKVDRITLKLLMQTIIGLQLISRKRYLPNDEKFYNYSSF